MARAPEVLFAAVEHHGHTYLALYKPGQEHDAIAQFDAWAEDDELPMTHAVAHTAEGIILAKEG